MSELILRSRARLVRGLDPHAPKAAEEGGCGVVGFAATVPVSGRNIFDASIQMHNRGNGKGGGIAAAGLPADRLGVSPEILRDDYLVHLALLDPAAEREVERAMISPVFEVHHRERLATVGDHREVAGLEAKPPEINRYFVRVKPRALDRFVKERGLGKLPRRAAEDEFVYQNSYRLNTRFYAALGEKQAFVMSHGRNLMILKIVGYAEQVVQYYRMEDFKANVWIAHQRYPTKGRVWHPGGAHPFIGLNEALVHNGDFANYHSVTEYLRQRSIYPLFLTDTEVSVLLFDYWSRVCGYPLEYIIESLAPTTELDLDALPEERQRVYRMLQAAHIHASPDGPWFFIIARSLAEEGKLQLVGITDTSMLRPQVFAIQEGEAASIGLVASEKQAIDATLQSLAKEDPRFHPVADRYWNARGGSSSDGGAFQFTIGGDLAAGTLSCTDKFGREIHAPAGRPADLRLEIGRPAAAPGIGDALGRTRAEGGAASTFAWLRGELPGWQYNDLRWAVERIVEAARGSDEGREWAIETLTLANDRRYPVGEKRRSSVLEILRAGLDRIFDEVPPLAAGAPSAMRRVDLATRGALRAPLTGETALVVDATGFEPEGEACDARLEEEAHRLGWRRFIVYRLRGQRFTACALGPASDDVRYDVYGSSGDYLASGIDGCEVVVHGNAQDQLGQIMKRGRLVVHGDVGQTFMYGAKGGEVYILGSGAGRPLINAAGRPRVVINGTCLDFLAESFMAGDPLHGGGFVVVNGLEFDDEGALREQPTPYPGSNLFSLASGGAIYLRDPRHLVSKECLNGGEFAPLAEEDWQLILPYLLENERLFGISVERDLLTVDGKPRAPAEVYRKVRAVRLAVLAKETVKE